MTANTPALDLSSTSPNFGLVLPSLKSSKCIYANVWFAYQIEGKKYGVSQGCCNHWDCPRCGQIRAKTEYARIVHGIHELSNAGHSIWFQTISCRGKEISCKDAEKGYLSWTNLLLDAYRARVKKQGGHWCYVQVTERQKRGHPHSHILTTFEPGDLVDGAIEKWERVQGILQPYWKDALRSEWLQEAVCRSGLGDQYDISKVEKEGGASRYVAKYLFKQTAFSQDWPPGWRRVRYSQSFPQLPEIKSQAFVIKSYQDWNKLASLALTVQARDIDVFEYAQWKLYGHDTFVTLVGTEKRREVDRRTKR